ncbi:MAG: GNAT family N-acetyltransferase [Hyphomicrobiales bacterium]|nr:GNAT family N-acetyltransferase [Hyphomicrobiales bacterium]
MPERNDAPARLRFRDACRADLEAVVGLLAADSLGSWRETLGQGGLPDAYYTAFDAIDRDPNNRLIIGDLDGKTVACLQLTFIPGLSYMGGTRAQIEGVRVDSELRGTGIGRALIGHAMALAHEKSCVLIQLTSDKRRTEAMGFYRARGFAASHEGMKLKL